MCDNKVVVNNTIFLQSNLGKKHNVVNYHVVRKADASGILCLGR